MSDSLSNTSLLPIFRPPEIPRSFKKIYLRSLSTVAYTGPATFNDLRVQRTCLGMRGIYHAELSCPSGLDLPPTIETKAPTTASPAPTSIASR